MATSAGISHNPFRTPAATTNTTEISSTPAAAPPPHTNTSAVNPDPTGFPEEDPPAYTPGPDFRQGESTIEYGPNRPFQRPPPPPTQPSTHSTQWPNSGPGAVMQTAPLQSHNTGSRWRQLTDQLTSQFIGPILTPGRGSRWSGYPGQQTQIQPNHTGYSPRPTGLHVPPLPPRPASMSTSNPSSQSEFARDFYAAGAIPPQQHSAPSSPAEYAPPPGPPPSSSSSYTPPTGPPPSSTPRHAPGSPPSASSSSAPDNGRPTQSPTPGHPLLRDGKLLVYPKGFTCDKCQNIGFKHADPSHPCRKCWAKYAKPFQGPLTYSFTNDPSSALSGSTFQRPLPSFRSPRQTSPPVPPAPPPPPQPSFYPPQPPSNLRTLTPYTPPPPNSIVYAAGDPRLGGRLCWNCYGRGTVSFLIFDSMSCEVCGGIGRILG